MTPSEWVDFTAHVTALWAGRGWSDATIEAAWPAFAEVDLQHAQRALAHLFKDGREFPPGPSLVYGEAVEQQRVSMPALSPPEAIRDLVEEETKRMESWRPRLLESMREVAAKRELTYDDPKPVREGPMPVYEEPSEAEAG